MSEPSNIQVLGIIGTDGVVPIYRPDDRWCLWNINELWSGTVGEGKYVPKVYDGVREYVETSYNEYQVESIHPVTLIPTLRLVKPSNMVFTFPETDVLFGIDPNQSDTYLAYVDKGVMPYILSVDARLRINGSMAKNAKIFKGADTSETGLVISRIYDNGGNFLTDVVELELVGLDNVTNYAIKAIPPCKTNQDLKDGEVVTIVIYSDNGHVVSKRQLKIVNTAFIRGPAANRKYVVGISLECPYISPTEEFVIEFPLNTPVSALNIRGVVNYSDGSSTRYSLGGKMNLYGIDQYVSTIVGQNYELVLSYTLGEDEAANVGVSADGVFVTAPYTLRTVEVDNSYNVKIFGYPIWINEGQGYRMEWYLLNLNRNIFINVTPYVEFAANTGPFDPKAYGYSQVKAITLNLSQASGMFKPYIHTQVVTITLVRAPVGYLSQGPDTHVTHWTVLSQPGNSVVPYGLDTVMIIAVPDEEVHNMGRVIDLKLGCDTFEQWLDKIYYRTYPLFDPRVETAPPIPTHFEIVDIYGSKNSFTVEEWNTLLHLDFDVPVNSTPFIRFYKLTALGEITLSVAAAIAQL